MVMDFEQENYNLLCEGGRLDGGDDDNLLSGLKMWQILSPVWLSP